MSSSAAVEGAVRRWAQRLQRCYDRLHSCSVLIERPHNHRTHGNHFHVRVDLAVPGRQITTSREPERDPGHEDVYVAIADAFRTARRQLLEHARSKRHGARRVA
jgi:hypothetical protein